jgi:tetratricopeptide (TPR) repeat protein
MPKIYRSMKKGDNDRPIVDASRGLLRLHVLTEAGQDDSPEADAIRDNLEHPWYVLSEAEKKRISGLSEDLYSISEPVGQPLPMNPQAQRKLLETIEARQAGDWDNALELLRRWGTHLDPAVLSFLRGSVWQEAGDCDTAIPFYQHAARLAPRDDKFACMYLSALRKSDVGAALKHAWDIVAHAENHQPLVVAQAADILATSTRGTTLVDARPVLQQLTQVLERALATIQSGEAEQFSAFESTHANITFLLGFCYERLGDFHTALHYHNLGLSIAPRNEALLVARGTLRYGVDPLAADDFEQAIRWGSRMVWPHFFLAHHHLVNNSFDKCRRMCERAMELPASDEVRANLNEWLAISETELGFPLELIRSAFEEAIRLAPGVDRIRRNLEEFESAATQRRFRRLQWDKPSDSVIQAVGQAGGSPLAA